VDIFFVLSGYLITTMLANELSATGKIDYRNFYIRRILRLWPAFAVFLFVVVLKISLSEGHKTVRETPLKSFLSIRPLVYTGKISYGFYLWHYPIVLGLSQYGAIGKMAALMLSFGLASASYHCIELPFFALKKQFAARPTTVTGSIVGTRVPGMILTSASLFGWRRRKSR
jgi:peptidoglycan/LPS O-acetylase OafA/YrhL